MCGFSGFLDGCGSLSAERWQTVLERMGDTIVHRGPDDHGIWMDVAVGVGLSHRRLSILDLSPAGHQPMVSPSGCYVIAFNGEIYNHQDLRRELGERNWRGHSDTETLLAAFDAWGIETTLRRASGMFAIALWDRQNATLTLARDRLGEKPLYYGHQNGVFLFGSELKALRIHPSFAGEIDRSVLALYLRFGYVPAPFSIYAGLRKLDPGCFLQIGPRGEPRVRPYWSLQQVVAKGQALPFAGSDAEAIDLLEHTLRLAVARQQVSDVPLGAFLSGGVDSSVIVALMQAQSSRPVRTFTIGFEEKGYNEAEHAKAVARHLGTDHNELYVTSAQAQAVIPRLPQLYDEPFADSSQIPTYLVSEMARRQVTVSLSGDAGDELFGGYNRYAWGTHILRQPQWLRAAAARGLTMLSPRSWNRLYGSLRPLLPAALNFSLAGDKAHKLAGVFGAPNQESVYLGLVSSCATPAALVLGATEPDTLISCAQQWSVASEFEHRMMYLDAMTYLPDDILVKVDRAAMGVSLETRVPFLDPEVVELAWRLPLSMKIRDSQGKWLLRQVLYRHVPRELIERPKMGFGVPIDSWLRGPLREWAESLLSETLLAQQGYFDPIEVRRKWREHLVGDRNWQTVLWGVLMFQAWLVAG